jgi:hypothetical protein
MKYTIAALLALAAAVAWYFGIRSLTHNEPERQEPAEFTVQPGQPDAEMLAGAWETDDPFAAPPAQMGIRLELAANRRVPFSHGKVTGDGVQKFVIMRICLYQRIARGEEHGWFSADPLGGASWDGHRLRMEYPGRALNSIIQGGLALDLAYNVQKGFWTGNYTRGGVSKLVRLTRPGASRNAQPNPFVGGWSERFDPSPRAPRIAVCVYIAQGADGAFVVWCNRSQGPIIDPREGSDVATFPQMDGDALGAQINGDTLTLQEGIDWGGVAGKHPEKFTGKLSPDGTKIIGTWVERNPESWFGPPSATFTKMTEGESCWSQPPSR